MLPRMSILRRAILALALISGFSPAFAAPPAAVPALPDAPRLATYTLGGGPGSICSCSFFPLYGDGTDYQSWVEVFINGVPAPYNDPVVGWTITSPTGSLGLIPRPVVDAILTFNLPVAGTIQIVGARRPRRISQFNDGRALTARDLNLAMTDIVATQREFWDKTNDITGRTLQSQPGVTLGRLPLPTTCQNGFLGFDATGAGPVCRSSSGAGNVTLPVIDRDLVMFDGTHGLLKDSGVSLPVGASFVSFITPQSLGFKCDGSSESGTIQAAVNALPSSGGIIYIPPGSTCRDSATVTINKPYVVLTGVSKGGEFAAPSSIVYTGTAARFIDARDTNGLGCSGVSILYSSSSFTGDLVHVGSATGNVSDRPAFNDCRLGPDTDRTGTATLINASATVDLLANKVFFYHGAPAIKGQAILGQNVRTTIRDSWFVKSDTIPINGCGEGWIVEGNSFEPLINGQAGAFINTAPLYCTAFAWRDNWHGDVTVTGGVWIDAYLQSADFTGNVIYGYSLIGGTGVILRGPSFGVNMDANLFRYLDAAVNVATAGTGLRMGQNGYLTSTAAIANPSNVTAGDFTLTSAGTNVISPGAVTFDKMLNIPTSLLLGRESAGTGGIEGISVGTAFVMTSIMSGPQLQTAAHTGDVTSPANSLAMTLETVNSNVGACGDGTHVAQVTLNAKGLATACSPVAITSAPPSGAAAGDLGGSYPSPTINNAPVIAKVLTGFASGAGTVSAADSILAALQKIDGNVALKAPLASPALTGTPTAPTAAVDTSTTQVATTAMVLGQAASATPLIDGSAAVGTSTRYARGDHVHPTDTTRAPLASPTFTGTPAGPTAAIDTNTTQLATTAMVLGQAASATPLIDGTAAAGTSTRYARGDHIHPTDTTRAPLVSPSFATPSLGVATATSINGVTLDNTGLTTYTSTFGASSGTATVVAKQKPIGKLTFVNIDVTFTSAVTGTFTVTLPTNSVNTGFIPGIVASAGIGAVGGVNAASNSVSVFTSAGAQILANGSHTVLTGWYESP